MLAGLLVYHLLHKPDSACRALAWQARQIANLFALIYALAIALSIAFGFICDRPDMAHPHLTLDTKNLPFEKIKRLTCFNCKSIDYIRKAEVARGIRSRDLESIAFKFGYFLVQQEDGKSIYYCYTCEREGQKQKISS